MTEQRKIVLSAVRKIRRHPTVDEVYTHVRRRLPRISLATVYRNLELLAAQGLIRQVDFARPQQRYDHRLHDHYHIRCVQCGRVDDVPIDPFSALEYDAKCCGDYRVLGHRLEFYGVCPTCQKRKDNRPPRTQKASPRLVSARVKTVNNRREGAE
jgi:Fur family ferric uptake transcriptional regulator